MRNSDLLGRALLDATFIARVRSVPTVADKGQEGATSRIGHVELVSDSVLSSTAVTGSSDVSANTPEHAPELGSCSATAVSTTEETEQLHIQQQIQQQIQRAVVASAAVGTESDRTIDTGRSDWLMLSQPCDTSPTLPMLSRLLSSVSRQQEEAATCALETELAQLKYSQQRFQQITPMLRRLGSVLGAMAPAAAESLQYRTWD